MVKKEGKISNSKNKKTLSDVKKNINNVSSNNKPVKGIVYNEKVFIENFVNLQNAMTNLSIKFSELSQNISKLLIIFEESAKNLAKSEKQIDGHVVNKIDSLLEQNKTIAKGLVLMEDQFKRQMKFPPQSANPNNYEQNKITKQPDKINSNNLNQLKQQNNIQQNSNQMNNAPESMQFSDKPRPLPQI